MYAVLRDALPEFLGSLGAGLVLALCGWGVARLRSRRAVALQASADDQQVVRAVESGPGSSSCEEEAASAALD
ncbi:hypothetical protein AB0O32_15505 [Streptomyces rubiginosohelvolus]|uniref:hypothetical protein n=1 Tax=Streptomyces rubiginosohelvolus TaxID=67362 RepID=UPI0034255150